MNAKQIESVREGLRRNVRMGGDVDAAQATADALTAILRRDWAVRVLDAWAEQYSWEAGRKTHAQWTCYRVRGRDPLPQSVWKCFFHDAKARCWNGPTSDAARLAAAEGVWPELLESERKRIGDSP